MLRRFSHGFTQRHSQPDNPRPGPALGKGEVLQITGSCAGRPDREPPLRAPDLCQGCRGGHFVCASEQPCQEHGTCPTASAQGREGRENTAQHTCRKGHGSWAAQDPSASSPQPQGAGELMQSQSGTRGHGGPSRNVCWTRLRETVSRGTSGPRKGTSTASGEPIRTPRGSRTDRTPPSSPLSAHQP